jgi:thioredoxin-related protein
MIRRLAFFALFAILPLFLLACATGGHGNHGTSHHRVEGSPASDIPIDWYSLSEGRAIALEQKMPMMVDFYAPEGCYRCEKYSKYLWSNPEIVEMVKQDFILVRINLMANMTSEEIAFGRKYDYDYNCMLIFLDCNGDIIEDVSGKNMCFVDYVEPDWFRKHLDRALEQNALVVQNMPAKQN